MSTIHGEKAEETIKSFVDTCIKVNATTGDICPLRNGDACLYGKCAWWTVRVEATSRAIIEGCAIGVVAMMVGGRE